MLTFSLIMFCDARSRCVDKETQAPAQVSEECKRQIEERALRIANALGEAKIIACQALWRRALCVSRFRILSITPLSNLLRN